MRGPEMRDALVSQVEYYFRLRRSRATASERALVRATDLAKKHWFVVAKSIIVVAKQK